jgi:hypothetical protein
MTESTSVLNTPVLWVNTYLKEKIEEFAELGPVPFFPTSPSTINDLTETFPSGPDAGGVFCVFDRMFRMRRGAFPHIKCEQILYYFYGVVGQGPIKMIKIQEAVLRLMDRGDETAEDINTWARTHAPIDGMTCKFYFHNFKIYQLEEARDIVDFGTARTYAGNKIIIDYDYHQSQDIIDSVIA